ncbi:MAG: thiamine-phosphate kinase [SAR202 cluster bacterium]|nr:thiamine-phosphate kinase [SAR202 cluster bacterium]
MANTVKDLGEFALIDRLLAAIHQRLGDVQPLFGSRLLVDVGDDAAAWRADNVTQLATTDTMVEGVHFFRSTTPWRDLGWKAMASNVSDIAAMGGLPLYALVTLGMPPDTSVSAIDELYAGMIDAAQEYKFRIIGGDIVRSPTAFITVALTGATDEPPLLRSAAHPSDLVATTCWLGSSAAGLRLLQHRQSIPKDIFDRLADAHRKPKACVLQGRILAKHGVRCAMDVSDGLVDDLSKLCKASGVSARIDAHKLPIDPALRATFPQGYTTLALGGGEDYGLIFTAPPQVMDRVVCLLPPPTSIIGAITANSPGKVTVVDASGKDITPAHGGWDHYR